MPIPANGEGSFGAIADDSAIQRAFVSFGSSVWIFDTSTNTFDGNVSVPGANQLVVDQATGVIYVASTSGLTVISPEPYYGIIYRG